MDCHAAVLAQCWTMTNPWDPHDYDERFGFVTSLGRELVGELGAKPGDRVLDVGCGTGHLTAAIAAAGAIAVGVDSDARMLERARAAYPHVFWVNCDILAMAAGALADFAPFDAVMSNAALHWVHRQGEALSAIRAVMRPGAHLVAEMGGRGNIAAVEAAFHRALADCGLEIATPGNFFPSLGQQAALLEEAGFRVDSMRWFARPTPLENESPVDWVAHFRAAAWAEIPSEDRPAVAERILEHAARAGLHDQHGWHIDYCRLRFRATALD